MSRMWRKEAEKHPDKTKKLLIKMSQVKSKEKKETKPDECVGCWNTVHYGEEKNRMKTNANNHKESFKHQPAVRSGCVFSHVCVCLWLYVDV